MLRLNIKQSFREILDKYLKRNKDYLLSDNVIHEMNGVVLIKTQNAIFDFYGLVIDDVIAYCKNVGCKPNKIVFASSYDIEIDENNPLFKMKMKMEGDSKVSIIKDGDDIVARVFIGEWVTLKKQK